MRLWNEPRNRPPSNRSFFSKTPLDKSWKVQHLKARNLTSIPPTLRSSWPKLQAHLYSVRTPPHSIAHTRDFLCTFVLLKHYVIHARLFLCLKKVILIVCSRHAFVSAYIDTYILHISFHSVLNNHYTLRQVPGTGRLTDIDAPTGYEPNVFLEVSVLDLSQSVFRKLRMTLIFGFANSLATTPLDLEINVEQATDLLASPLSLRSEKQVQTDHKFITRKEKT